MANLPSGMQNAPTNGPTPPFIAVIIPVYNDAARLELCLAALAKQRYPAERYEVVVVDNGSSEDIRELCERHDRVRYLFEAKPGSYAARNTGIRCARHADILAFTDSDCIPEPDWLAMGVAALSHPDVGAVGGKVELFFKNPARPTSAELYESVKAFPQESYIQSGWSVTANLFVRREVFDHVGLFDDALKSGGDMEWGKRATGADVTLRYAGEAVVTHPARASLAELRKKERRVSGGLHNKTLRRDPSVWNFLRTLARQLYYGLRTSRTLLGHSRLSPTQKLQVIGVLWYMKGVRFSELIALRINRRRQASRG